MGLSVDRWLVNMLLLLHRLSNHWLSAVVGGLWTVLQCLALSIVVVDTLRGSRQVGKVKVLDAPFCNHLLAQSSFFRHFCHDESLSLSNWVKRLLLIQILARLAEWENRLWSIGEWLVLVVGKGGLR